MRLFPIFGLALGVALIASACSSSESAVEPAALPAAPTASIESVTPEPTSIPTPSQPKGKVLYLTFDDGPTKPYTTQLLTALQNSDATATFFVNGNMARANPDVLQAITDAGQAIGNHSYDHPNFTSLSDAEVANQIKSTTKVVGAAMGACVRPPYLATNDRIRAVTKGLGYATIMGDLAAQDWTNPSVPDLVASLRGATRDGNVIILHDGPADRANTVAAVKQMLPVWRKQGYSLAALPKCSPRSS
ncbi:MAG: polysaccharide deacetylase family protein [Actinomycetia bacterium]|nr:polysaccharide deacetylase family protein [Actinomycetes bacterium]